MLCQGEEAARLAAPLPDRAGDQSVRLSVLRVEAHIEPHRKPGPVRVRTDGGRGRLHAEREGQALELERVFVPGRQWSSRTRHPPLVDGLAELIDGFREGHVSTWRDVARTTPVQLDRRMP